MHQIGSFFSCSYSLVILLIDIILWQLINKLQSVLNNKMGLFPSRKAKQTKLISSVNDEELQKICSEDCRFIIKLSLSDNQITPIGLYSFSRVNWENLAILNLIMDKIGDKGCKFIAKTPMKNLTEITYNLIGSTGMLHLSKANWPNLREFFLNHNKAGGQSIQSFVRANFKAIKHIELQFNSLTVQQLQYFLLTEFQSLQKIMLINYLCDIKTYFLFKKNLKMKLDLQFV